jgi:hypothetical protein
VEVVEIVAAGGAVDVVVVAVVTDFVGAVE